MARHRGTIRIPKFMTLFVAAYSLTVGVSFGIEYIVLIEMLP